MDIHVIINSPIQLTCLICWLFTCIVSNYNRNEQSKPRNHTRPITITLFTQTNSLGQTSSVIWLLCANQQQFILNYVSQAELLVLHIYFSTSDLHIEWQSRLSKLHASNSNYVHCHHLMSYGQLKVVNIFCKHMLHLLE